MGILSTQEGSSSKGANPLQKITAILPRSKWSVLLLRIVMQEAMSDVLNVYPQLRMKDRVDDIKVRKIRSCHDRGTDALLE